MPPNRWLLTFAALLLATAALLGLRELLDATHVALAYLLVVLGAGSRGGRALGIAVSAAAFLAFNFFFLPPYYTLAVADPLDWTVLLAFLATALVGSQLLVRARKEAASAEVRAGEVERLSALGAETLKAARAEDALSAIAEVVRATLDALLAEIHVRGERGMVTVARAGLGVAEPHPRALGQPSEEGIITWVAEHGRSAVELADGSVRVGEGAEAIDAAAWAGERQNIRMLLLPLHVRERSAGVLTVAPRRVLQLDAAAQQFLRALSYYAALGVERWRLARDAERAEELHTANEAKNAVLASVSHDLRTPLTTIKALAHEIRQGGDERAAVIEEEADRLNRFVADLLDLSRLAAGAVQVVPEINAAEDLVGAALQRVPGAAAAAAAAGAAGHGRVVASLDPTESLLLGRFDFVQSLRVLSNLIDNAVKFSPPGSRVEVNARRRKEKLEFVVADRGPGIPPSDREAVYQPFYRQPGTAPDVGGAGLGLSIARGLAEAQGGTLSYQEREGGGSCFVFAVPAADATDLEVTEFQAAPGSL